MVGPCSDGAAVSEPVGGFGGDEHISSDSRFAIREARDFGSKPKAELSTDPLFVDIKRKAHTSVKDL